MVSIDKTDVKTAQGNMRHAGPEIMVSKFAQVVTDENACGGSRVVGWVWVRISYQKMPEGMRSNEPEGVHGERGRTRTCDPCLKRALLYQLSYAPTYLTIPQLSSLFSMTYEKLPEARRKPRIACLCADYDLNITYLFQSMPAFAHRSPSPSVLPVLAALVSASRSNSFKLVQTRRAL